MSLVIKQVFMTILGVNKFLQDLAAEHLSTNDYSGSVSVV